MLTAALIGIVTIIKQPFNQHLTSNYTYQTTTTTTTTATTTTTTTTPATTTTTTTD